MTVQWEMKRKRKRGEVYGGRKDVCVCVWRWKGEVGMGGARERWERWERKEGRNGSGGMDGEGRRGREEEEYVRSECASLWRGIWITHSEGGRWKRKKRKEKKRKERRRGRKKKEWDVICGVF